MFDVRIKDKPTLENTAKLLFNGMLIGVVTLKFAEIVTGKRLTP